MNRVLVTGGAGTIGQAVVRRLLRDPDFEVRVSDQREAPLWIREGCEVHTGDLRVLAEEIGRASCRARVEISVVAVSLKKKKNAVRRKSVRRSSRAKRA